MSETGARLAIKQEKYARIYNDGTILCLRCRFAYPHIFTPFKGRRPEDKSKYGVVGLWDKDADHIPTVRMISEYMNDILRENKNTEMAPANKFLRNGDQAGKLDYKGKYTISASESRPPIAMLARRDPRTKKPIRLSKEKDESVIYGGCWGNIIIRPWYMNNGWGKKLNAGLLAAQFVDDDEPFGQGRISEDDVADTFDEFANDTDSGFDDSLGDNLDL